MIHRFMICSVALLLFAMHVEAGRAPEDPAPRASLRVVRESGSERIDPHSTTASGDFEVCALVYETLVRRSVAEPGTVEPALAESWTVSADGREYSFALRKNVMFHDGAELTAEVAKRSFERARNADDPTTVRGAPFAEELDCIESIEAPQSHKLVLKLKQRRVNFLLDCTSPWTAVISPKAIEGLTKQPRAARTEWMNHHSCGSGPFKLEMLSSDEVRLSAHDKYWGGPPAVSTLILRTQRDPKARAEMLIAGDADFVDGLPPDLWELVGKCADVKHEIRDDTNLCYLAMNCDPKSGFITSELKVRQAIALAIDREPICKLLAPASQAQHVLLPPISEGHPKGYKPKLDEKTRAEAIKEAKKLLEDSGAAGKELTLTLPAIPRPYLPKPREIADLLRQQLEAVGLKVTVEPRPMVEIGNGIAKGSFALLLLGWMSDRPCADDFWGPLLGGDGGPGHNNTARFFDKAVQARIDAARDEIDAAKRTAIYEGLEKTVHDTHRPIVPLFTMRRSWAWRKNWRGIEIDSAGNWRFEKASTG